MHTIKALLTGIALAAIMLAGHAAAQTQTRETPAGGETRTVAIGGTVWEQYQYEGIPGVTIEAPVQARWGSVEMVALPAGSGLFILREKKLKACATRTVLPNIGATIWSNCLFDLDDDGRFEKVSYNSAGASKAIDPPVAYQRGLVEVAGDGAPNFRRVLLYLGFEGSALKLSYREFATGTARPAFTEEFSVPLDTTFPQNIAVKDRVITILGIDGMGLRYSLAK